MSWKIRHQGSPKAVEGLTLGQIVEGLQDGHWEVTDEVMGPQDTAWVPIESHPQLEEVAADLELPPPKVHDDETHVDMNALIDVCLVLLIFFILTSSYAALQKMLDSPNLTGDEQQKGVISVSPKQVADLMIQAEVTESPRGPIIQIEGQPVDKKDLVSVLQGWVRSTHKTDLLLKYDRMVPHGTIVTLEDAAKTAKIDKVHIVIPPEELNH